MTLSVFSIYLRSWILNDVMWLCNQYIHNTFWRKRSPLLKDISDPSVILIIIYRTWHFMTLLFFLVMFQVFLSKILSTSILFPFTMSVNLDGKENSFPVARCLILSFISWVISLKLHRGKYLKLYQTSCCWSEVRKWRP